MSREWLFIEANDVLMFRDSKPFVAGQNFVARSMFPPTPRTMQGVIRTHYLELQGVDWADYKERKVNPKILKAIGGPDDLGELRLQGPFVGRESSNGKIERLIRAPLDLLQRKGDDSAQSLVVLAPESKPSFETNAPFEGWRALRGPDAGSPEYEEVAGWLDDASLQNYLAGKLPARIIKDTGDGDKDPGVFDREERVGLGLDYGRRTGKQSLFYHAHFVRPRCGVGLLVEVNQGLFPPAGGVIAIGGEGRMGCYRRVSYTPVSSPVKGGRIKIVLLTPAYFSGGWQPRNGDWSPWLGKNARLISMAIGKPLLISGWDLANSKSRPLHHYLPAGSVFYFEDAEPPRETPFTETPPDSADAGAMGFGAFVAANWNYR